MKRIRLTGVKGDFIELRLPSSAFRRPRAKGITHFDVKLSTGPWKGTFASTYASTISLGRFLDDLKTLAASPNHAARLQKKSDLIWINVARNPQGEVWIYGHIEDTPSRAKLAFSFDSSLRKLKTEIIAR